MLRETPLPKAVKDLFDELLGRPVTVAPGTPMKAADLKDKPLTCLYVDDRRTLGAVIGMDLPLAAYAGAALGLIPASGAESCIEEKELSQMVAENVTEVCNILSSLLNREGYSRLKVHQTFLPGQLPPPDGIGYLLALGRRLDLTVDVQGYGTGRIWIAMAKA